MCPQEASRELLPPAYALELLTIFAWERGCGKNAFSLAQGLRTVLGLVQDYRHLCVFWTLNYSFEDPALRQFLRRQLERPRYPLMPHCPPSRAPATGRCLRLIERPAWGPRPARHAHFLVQGLQPQMQIRITRGSFKTSATSFVHGCSSDI